MDLVVGVDSLKSTTFCGRRFSRAQIQQILDTASTFGNLSRHEMALTICEHLSWKTPSGSLKVNSALEILDKLESLGLYHAPARLPPRKRSPEKLIALPAPDASLAVIALLASISPISLKVVDQAGERRRFNSLMDQHHYLGYKCPFGSHLRYFILDKDGRELGLLLFAASAWSLKARDEWIGWERKHRVKRLHLIVSNSRFLILPWVKVPNLASKVLSMVTAQLAADWQERYAYRPVLIETFVERERYLGTSYQAANWQKIGETTGLGRTGVGKSCSATIKDIYLQPLTSNFRDVLLRGELAIKESSAAADIDDILCRAHDSVLSFWTMVAPLIRRVAAEFDATWQVKRRVVDSMLLVLLIFRLVATRAKQGYGTTIDELWHNCRKQGLPLPQKKPIAASAFTVARHKLDEQIFKTINSRVISQYESFLDGDEFLFLGHRVYAVDGTKLNLPRSLLADGFKVSDKNAHYPLGLFSSLYRLRSQIPVDFSLSHNMDERAAALGHLACLRRGDIVVYDRGYFSFGMLSSHLDNGINSVFRLVTKSTYIEVQRFASSESVDVIVEIAPGSKSKICNLRKRYPGIDIKPLALRLVKYEVNGNIYCLGTTLLDPRYSRDDLKDLYHARWGIEELYKISKHLIAIEEFHAKSLRGVKQELYAHMAMITMNRVFTNESDRTRRAKPPEDSAASSGKQMGINFKSALSAFSSNFESLVLGAVDQMRMSVVSLLDRLSRRYQRVRPNRSYPRLSHKPKHKWSKPQFKKVAKAA